MKNICFLLSYCIVSHFYENATVHYLRLYKYMTLETFHETPRLGGLRATFAQQSVNLMEFKPDNSISTMRRTTPSWNEVYNV